MNQIAKRIDDPLWKSILEEAFTHFLQFIFPDADQVFDLNRSFEYLDKEFESMFPPEANGRGVRYVDKLAKVYLKDGSEKFILCHVEVQSSRGKGDLAKRMYEYFYKIYDRYKVDVTAIAILADSNNNYRPSCYVQQFMGTKLRYDFNNYKIIDQDEAMLRANTNPFSVVVLTALLAIQNKNMTDEKLKNIKHDLYDEMMKRNMDKQTRQGIYNFLTYYVSFDNQQVLSIFEEEINKKQGRRNTMGTQEYLLDKANKEGKTEKAIAIALELIKMGFSIDSIAKGTGLSIEEVQKLKTDSTK